MEVQKVGIRPENLGLCDVAHGVAARVMLAEHLGDASIIHLQVEGLDTLLTAKLASQDGLLVTGQLIGLKFEPSAVLAFSKGGELLPQTREIGI
jgi:multiple sugar transport system ATP-binding protein